MPFVKRPDRLASLLTVLLGLSGCALFDQNSFAPPPHRAAVARSAPVPPPPSNGALVTIILEGPEPDYQDSLAAAVQQALSAKPDVLFQVVSMVPEPGGKTPSWQQAEMVTVWGRRVAEQIERDGVDQGQISLGLRATPGLDHGEIRVYVQ